MPDPLEQPTAKLAAGARTDRDGFGRLYQRVAPSLHAWVALRATASLRSAVEIGDVVQEVWCRALAGLATYQPARASFRTWIFSIANHVVLDAYRRLGRSGGAPPRTDDAAAGQVLDDVTSITRRIARDEAFDRCVKTLAALPEDELALVIHCGLEGRTAAECGRLLGASADAVAKRWQRLRARLREAAAFQDLLAP